MVPKMMKKMENAVAWFEIPVVDMDRAKKFYEGIFDIELIDLELENELNMSMFPVEEGGVGGSLCEYPEFYKPSKEGTLVYLNADPDLQLVLDKVEDYGGNILQEKTQITEEYGYMAILEDTEGNRVALHSMK